LRLLKEPFVGRASNEESIAEFVERRLGREFLDYAIDPFVAGVYAAKPEKLSVRAAFPKLHALEEKYGGLIRGMIGGRKERKLRKETAKDRAESFSFLDGMESFPRGLAAVLRDRIITNASVSSVREQPVGHGMSVFTVNYATNGTPLQITADAVILATPAFVSADLLGHLSREIGTTLRSIHYSPVASIFFGVRRADIGRDVDGFGFLVPTVERRNILGCLWSSSLFPGRAQEGMSALTCFVGGGRQPGLLERDDPALVELAGEDLKSIMQITGKPVYFRVTRWPQAIPQYELGHMKLMVELDRFEVDHPGLFLCSNYRGGIAVGDCVMNAHRTAVQVLARLRPPPDAPAVGTS
ncbi:MAG: protoporphyrinogen oxidase, partial [Bacteroidota bacterium]